MRVLVVASRFPWPSTTGDRLRAAEWIAALGATGAVTLVSPPGDAALVPPGVRHVPAPVSPLRAAGAAIRTIARRLPLQDALGGRADWAQAFHELGTEPFDVVICLLTRTLPWIDARRLARCVVVDAVDALSRSMEERARGANRVLRGFWRREARLTLEREKIVARDADAVVVVGSAEAEPFDGRAAVIPVGVEILPADGAPRDVDCAFWGRLGFFANRDAADLLIREVWPSVRAAVPSARLVIAGADAPASVRRAHGRDGIEVESPMRDRVALLRRARIAVIPVRFGTGQSVKLLEACAAGLAVAAFQPALRGVVFPAEAAAVSDSSAGLARAIIDLLGDRDGAARMGAAGRAWVAEHFDREATRAMMRELVERTVARRGA